jgi:CRP-like cAMP-binding protein
MTIEDDIAFLERVPTLAVLGRDALRILAIGADNRYVHGGEVLFSAGDEADAGFLVQEGSFTLTLPHPDNDKKLVVGRGTLLGELALLTETKRRTTATAVEPSTVLRIPRNLFLKMLEGYPEAAWRLHEAMLARANQSTAEIYRLRDALDLGEPN